MQPCRDIFNFIVASLSRSLSARSRSDLARTVLRFQARIILDSNSESNSCVEVEEITVRTDVETSRLPGRTDGVRDQLVRKASVL